MTLAADVDRIAAESGFAGVVRVDRAGTTELWPRTAWRTGGTGSP